jgi:hypothetical protein
MSRGTVTKLLLLCNFIAIAIVIGFGIWLVRQPSPAPINHCAPSDRANPWCGHE